VATRSSASWLEGRRAVGLGCAASLGLGLFFIFVWRPHPWGWQGIDQYYALALALARHEPFGTTDVPWGYAYFLAFFYWAFGDRPWIPLVAQALLNGLVPWLVYRLVAALVDRRTAALAALLVGFLSFNTVYASTQTSDSVCTVIFLAAVLLATSGESAGRLSTLALAGVAFGAASQFRPNLIAFPLVWAAVSLWKAPLRRASWLGAVLIVACSAAADVPWIVRNYRLTREILPTSTHGSMQLWYGTLQVGPYLRSRALNPASVFETPSFDYVSLERVPIEITASPGACSSPDVAATLVWWTDRSRVEQRATGRHQDGRQSVFEIPAQPLGTTVYYFIEVSQGASTQATPPEGRRGPAVLFVSADHLGDMDVHQDVLDAFDVVRLLRHHAWHEPAAPHLDLNGDGRIDDADLRLAVPALLGDGRDWMPTVESSDTAASLTLVDGSRFEVPRQWSGRITDVRIYGPDGVDGREAARLLYARRTLASLRAEPVPPTNRCLLAEVAVNASFYRREPQAMRRYNALAFDNIRRNPLGYAAASLYRVFRVFVVMADDDTRTVYSYRASRLIYRTAMGVSIAYLALFVAGLIVAIRTRTLCWQLVLPIVYIPATLCFVLTNMRYTVTAQPFVFVFIALALRTAREAWTARRRGRTAPTEI
jgi:hypothetical protein